MASLHAPLTAWDRLESLAPTSSFTNPESRWPASPSFRGDLQAVVGGGLHRGLCRVPVGVEDLAQGPRPSGTPGVRISKIPAQKAVHVIKIEQVVEPVHQEGFPVRGFQVISRVSRSLSAGGRSWWLTRAWAAFPKISARPSPRMRHPRSAVWESCR